MSVIFGKTRAAPLRYSLNRLAAILTCICSSVLSSQIRQQLETGLRAPVASTVLSYSALSYFPSGNRSVAIRAPKNRRLPRAKDAPVASQVKLALKNAFRPLPPRFK